MSHYIGVWKFDEPIYCCRELSGKSFVSYIADTPVVLAFPSVPVTYENNLEALAKGDLLPPINGCFDTVNWGMVTAWPEGLFALNALLIIVSCEEDAIAKIYADFPRWKKKFYSLCLINSGNYLRVEQELPAILTKGNGIYDGVEFFECSKGKPLERIRNTGITDPISMHFAEHDECYTEEKMRILLTNTGDKKEINLPYELLIVGYRAFMRKDFRSAVIVAGSGLEKAAENRIKQEYLSAAEGAYERDSKKYRMLGGKFHWLEELEISIPVIDYKVAILDVRNDTTHEGLCPSEEETKAYLEKCKTLIEIYSPNVLTQE